MGKLLLVGCGKMGGAMLEGWLARGLAASDVVVAEPVEAMRPKQAGLRVVASIERDRRDAGDRRAGGQAAVDGRDAARPASASPTRARCSCRSPPARRWAISRAISATTAKVVRSMPNTPAAVRQGITRRHGGRRACRRPRRSAATNCSKRSGQVLWVDDEALMDPVTALSGSGPAYVFLLVEAMAAAGAKLGLTPDMAMQLARATVAGSGELLQQSSEPASQLRVNVTSPGGTTAEALKVLMAPDGIQPVFDKALAAASRRSKELAG